MCVEVCVCVGVCVWRVVCVCLTCVGVEGGVDARRRTVHMGHRLRPHFSSHLEQKSQDKSTPDTSTSQHQTHPPVNTRLSYQTRRKVTSQLPDTVNQ